VAHDLGANERIIVVCQYLRVALLVLSMPLILTYGVAGQTVRIPVRSVAEAAGPWWISVGFLVTAIHRRHRALPF
jgi:uncharacterized protein